MQEVVEVREHPRRITWRGASALALGGSNQSIFLIGALLAAQGSAAIPILILGLVLSYTAVPGWIELSCMFPNRVGGIAATCAEAFRPYSAVLANLTGVCYWWGWVPTCGLTAIFSANAIHQWYLPGIPDKVLATVLVLIFMGVNLCGLKWAVRLAMPIAIVAGFLALCTSLLPIFAGHVDWHQASSFHLLSPFSGTFGKLTSAMAGLYLVGFAAPAFEAAACHMGEMKKPSRDQPWAMWVSGGVASIYFVLIPVVWLGVFGSTALQGNLASLLGPTFAPIFGSLAKAAAIWFITFNMFSGTIQPLSGASRTLSQLSEDGLLPRSIGWRSVRTDAPAVAIVITALASIVFLLSGDPTSVIAAANLTYLIGIGLPSLAVWILRRNEPDRERLYTARSFSIKLGVVAAAVWLASALLGFEQFGLPVVVFGLVLAYSGSTLYAWRLHQDRKALGVRGPRRSIHLKLTGAMLAVLALDTVGYLVAVNHVTGSSPALIAILKDIFVAVGLLTISVGLVLPGMIAHTANQVAQAASELADGTLLNLTVAMEAIAAGDFDQEVPHLGMQAVEVRTRDEFGEMAKLFNVMQQEAGRAAIALETSVGELRQYRDRLEELVELRTSQLVEARGQRRQLLEKMRALSTKVSVREGSSPNLPEMMNDLLVGIGAVMNVDGVTMVLANEFGQLESTATVWRRTSVGSGLTTETLSPEVTNSLNAFVQGRQSLGVTDLQTTIDPLNLAVKDFIEENGIRGWLGCPISTSDGVIAGFLGLMRLDQFAWGEDDIALAETVSDDLSRAIIAARLFENQQEVVLQLRELDQTRSEMLSTFSHEIRTPLASIRAYAELLRQNEKSDPEQDDKMLEIIEQNSVRLSTLLEDVLTLSHLSSDVFEGGLAPLNFDALILQAVEVMLLSAEGKGIVLNLQLGAEFAMINGNDRQLERMMFNIVGNAIKFTKEGGSVTISTGVKDANVAVTVADTGIGIPSTEIPKVFDQFYRGSNAVQAVIPGSGLGLSIVQAIVDHHDGQIEIVPNTAGGVTVTVTMPLSEVVSPVGHEGMMKSRLQPREGEA